MAKTSEQDRRVPDISTKCMQMNLTQRDTVLIVGRDAAASAALRALFEEAGFVALANNDARDLVTTLKDGISVVVLDMLSADASDVMHHIEAVRRIPLILVNAPDTTIGKSANPNRREKNRGPCYATELIALATAIVRGTGNDQKLVPPKFSKRLKLFPLTATVNFESQILQLRRHEFNLLVVLLASPDQIATRDTLYKKVWGGSRGRCDRRADMHISNLRNKLRGFSHGSLEIETIRSVGYRLKVSP
jgi:two-component system OmpR family response regulator